jgi:dethiobiotin synthetase
MIDGRRGFFVAGTDTGVGKTHVAVALTRALAQRGLRTAVMKPVAAGTTASRISLRNEDAVALIAASNVTADYATVNPYLFELPVSPHLAAAAAGVTIELAKIQRAYETLAANADVVIVEGAGGWLSPIGPQATMANIAQLLQLPIVLVVGLRLGCLNHTALTRD